MSRGRLRWILPLVVCASALLFPDVGGNVEVTYDHLISDNVNIVTKDEADLALSPGPTAGLTYLLLWNVEKWTTLVSLTTTFDKGVLPRLTEDYLTYHGVSTVYHTSPLFKIDGMLDAISINLNRESLNILLGDAQAKANTLVLSSKSIRGFFAENTFDLTRNTISVGDDERKALIDALDNPYGTSTFNISDFYFEDVYQPKFEIYANVFAGESEKRAFDMAEGDSVDTTSTNDSTNTNVSSTVSEAFIVTNREYDLNGNGIKDSATSATYRQAMAGFYVNATLAQFTVEGGFVFLQDDKDSLDYTDSDALFVGASEMPVAKMVAGLGLGLDILPSILSVKGEAGLLIKDDDVTDTTLFTNALLTSYLATVTYLPLPEYTIELIAKFAQSGYEDATGASSADEDLLDITLSQTYVSGSWGDVSLTLQFYRDNMTNFSDGYATYNYYAGVESAIAIAKSTLYAANYFYYSDSVNEGDESEVNNVKENVKLKWKKEFPVIDVTPYVNYTFYMDNTDSSYYNQIEAGASVNSSFFDDQFTVSGDVQTSFKIDESNLLTTTINPQVEMAAKLLNRKLAVNVNAGYVFFLDENSSSYDKEVSSLFAIGTEVDWYITTQFLLGVHYRYAGKAYEFTTDDVRQTSDEVLNNFTGHIIGGQFTWLY